ncbi:hypothetical protein IG631_13232 [Alternaria alternata]|nr:hypothetical protein IG631_13232 [Alternaria alternata]
MRVLRGFNSSTVDDRAAWRSNSRRVASALGCISDFFYSVAELQIHEFMTPNPLLLRLSRVTTYSLSLLPHATIALNTPTNNKIPPAIFAMFAILVSLHELNEGIGSKVRRSQTRASRNPSGCGDDPVQRKHQAHFVFCTCQGGRVPGLAAPLPSLNHGAAP